MKVQSLKGSCPPEHLTDYQPKEGGVPLQKDPNLARLLRYIN